MSAFVDKAQFGIGDQTIEIVPDHGGSNRVVESPHEEGRHFYQRQFFGQIVALRRLGNGHNVHALGDAFGGFKYFRHQFFGSYFGVIKSIGYPFADIFQASAAGISSAHRIFKKSRAARKHQTRNHGGVVEGVEQSHMSAEGVSHDNHVAQVSGLHKTLGKVAKSAKPRLL